MDLVIYVQECRNTFWFFKPFLCLLYCDFLVMTSLGCELISSIFSNWFKIFHPLFCISEFQPDIFVQILLDFLVKFKFVCFKIFIWDFFGSICYFYTLVKQNLLIYDLNIHFHCLITVDFALLCFLIDQFLDSLHDFFISFYNFINHFPLRIHNFFQVEVLIIFSMFLLVFD